MDDFEAPRQAPKSTQKRSFFSKPAATIQDISGDENDGGADFFRQSGNYFSSIMHEQEKKKQRRLVRKMKEKAAQYGSDEDMEAPLESRKRRKMSIEDDADTDLAGRAHSPPHRMRSRSNSPTLRTGRQINKDPVAASMKPGFDEVIEVADSTPEASIDDDVDELYAAPTPRKSPSNLRSNPVELIEVAPEGSGDLEEDDEDAELVAKLLERNRQRELDALKTSPSRKGETQAGRTRQLSSTPPDPPVSVLISSTIQDTRPLIVRIYLSKKIAELLKTWCNFNNLTKEQSAEVFLAWRRLKQWPTTTLRGMLGGAVDFEVSDDGAIVSRPGCRGEGLSDDFNKIHLVATTEDGLAQLKSRHQRALHADQDPDSEGELNGGLADVPTEGAQAKTDDNIPITLKQGREYGELKIKVKRDTTIARIITAFRKAKKIPDDKAVTLSFDGDILDPDNVMAETEIEDRDTIEVYVR